MLFFIIEALQTDALVQTLDVISNAPLQTNFENSTWRVPSHYFATFPTKNSISNDKLCSTFCPFVNLFENEKNARAFAQNNAAAELEYVNVAVLIKRDQEIARARQCR